MRSCPKCKSSDYNNRNFALMINECGHSLCRNCVETLFARNSAPCPSCGKTLKKNGFWEQLFDDPMIEKEVFFRKKLQKIYNLHRDDFHTLAEYNDYLESFEILVCNFVNDIDVEETKKKVEEFQKSHEQVITRNRNRKSDDELWVQKHLEEERRFRRRLAVYQEEDANRLAAEKGGAVSESKAVIEELKQSNEPAAFIVNNKQREQRELEKTRQESDNCDVKRHSLMEGVESTVGGLMDLGEAFTYQPPTIHLNGPGVPDLLQLTPLGYLVHIRAATPDQVAGGYHESFACHRALLEASSDLFWI